MKYVLSNEKSLGGEADHHPSINHRHLVFPDVECLTFVTADFSNDECPGFDRQIKPPSLAVALHTSATLVACLYDFY